MPSLERKRKFLIALLALVFTLGLAMAGKVDGGQWVTAVGLIVGLYGGAEALEGRGHRGES